MVCLGFLLPIERLFEKKVDPAGFFAGDTLIGMVGESMTDLVRQHSCQLIVVLRDLEDGGIDGNLASRQAKGVHPPVLDDIGLPFESVTFDVQVNFALQGLDAGGPNDLRRDGADAPDACIFRRQDAAAILAQDLPVGLLADGQFLIGQKSQTLRPVARPFALFFRQT